MQDEQIQWRAPEYAQKEHGADWYWVVGAVALAITAVALIFNNILLAVLVVIGTTALILQTLKKPPVVSFAVTHKGIRIGKLFYRYQDLDSFAVAEENILIKSKKPLAPYIVIPVPPEHQEGVYMTLTTYLPEEEYEESTIEKIMDEFGF